MKNIEFTAEKILNELKALKKSAPLIIAIDGRCASGKTTLAALLKEKTGCNVIHADDFFLRKEQRTKQRLEEPGGNIDYERLEAEVLISLRHTGKCQYRKFDCRTMSLCEEAIVVEPAPLTIVEGSYSCHPRLFNYYDFSIFLNVEQDEQIKRILQRNGKEKAENFKNKWIPLEEKYFSAFNISEICNMIITM